MLTRRRLLQGTAATGTCAAFAGFPRLSLARATTEKRLVIVLLRGGLDGLNTVIPYADPAYRAVRGSLALPSPGEPGGVIDLDGWFGIHPALAPLAPHFEQGEFAAVHAVGLSYRGRSHFDAQDVLENGTERPTGARDGWLNRAIGEMGPADRRLGLSVGRAVPFILRGPAHIAAWAPDFLPDLQPTFLDKIETLYARDPLL